MRSLSVIIEKFFGLRPTANSPKNEGLFVQLRNMIPFGSKIQEIAFPTRLADLTEVEDAVWPFPQLIKTNRFLFIADGQNIYLLSVDGLTVLEEINLASASTKRWSVCDYITTVLFTNGTYSVLYKEIGDAFSDVSDTIPPALGTVDYNGQCLLFGTSIKAEI